MMKKIFVLCIGFCFLLFFNQANAFEYDKKTIMKEFNCKAADTMYYADANIGEAITKENRIFEDDTIKIETFIGTKFDNLIVDGQTRKTLAIKTVILAFGGNPMMGFNTEILVAPCVTFRITNKTVEPLEFDINHSQITVCSYQGRGVQAGTQYNGAVASSQFPIMIFPKTTKDITLFRTDNIFYKGYYFQGTAIVENKWLPPFDVVPDRNLLGDMILCINKKYITFTPVAVLESSKLKWGKAQK